MMARFFFIFHALSFELNFFLDQRIPLRTTVPFVTAHFEIFHFGHHPVTPKSDLYFTFCFTLRLMTTRIFLNFIFSNTIGLLFI